MSTHLLVIGTSETGTLGGSSLASWTPVYGLMIAYFVVVAVLWVYGQPADGDKLPLGALQRIGRGLTRLTGIPGWAAIAIGQSLYSLLFAGVGFYSDVQWHIAMGRDDELFTAPHTAILFGLIGILAGSVFGIIVATLDGWDRGWTVWGLRVPYSMLPLGALGVGAVSGFPMDEIWHAAFGVDVTMWSPTHMLMILGASFTGLAAWLILANTGVRPSDSGWAKFAHGLAAWLTLQGLVAGQGEFTFGVPQFAHVFHPMLISMAAALGLVAIRLVLGRGRALLIGLILAATQFVQLGGDGSPVETRHGATFIVSALVVEAVAALVGTRRRVRFAVTSGIGVGTIGLAGEWAWNTGAHQAWNSSLLPYAVTTSVIAGVGCALLGVGFARAFPFAEPGDNVRPAVIGVGLVLAVLPVLWFLPRPVGTVSAEMTIEPVGVTAFGVDGVEAEGAHVTIGLTPPGAADNAHWFQATSWQGGGLVLSDMVEVEPGLWRTEDPVPIDGLWKTLVRLHRKGNEMMTVPVWFPEDPEIDEPEIPAVDRTMAFAAESQYLMRETNDDGAGWLSPVVHGYLALTLAAWFVAFVVGVRNIGGASGVRLEPGTDPPKPAVERTG